MKKFRQFITQIEAIALKSGTNSDISSHPLAIAALNGEVSKVFRTTVSLSDRRENGIFFTNEKLAKIVTHRLIQKYNHDTLIADPACGTGDLLLACANKLPIGGTLVETLNIWGNCLMGFDVFPDFIKATKVRLLLLAKMKTNLWNPAIVAVDNYFPLIRVQDFLEDTSGLEKASHIVINPPYSKIMAPDDCKWANKKISAASLFIERCISNANANAKIRAILPDVLRTGSSYLKWREQVESSSRNMNISIYGQFDEWTDVDVFILRLQKLLCDKRILSGKWNTCIATESTLGNYFDVRVGPVVPHRDPEKGPLLAYLHARTATAWKELNHISEKRKYAGTVFSPPFVVVRRTSRPGEKRAIGAIVKGKRKVAVENHLLVLLPKKKSIEECRKLLRTLKSQETDDWFNQRIRCRHLTVEAMKELPYGG